MDGYAAIMAQQKQYVQPSIEVAGRAMSRHQQTVDVRIDGSFLRVNEARYIGPDPIHRIKQEWAAAVHALRWASSREPVSIRDSMGKSATCRTIIGPH